MSEHYTRVEVETLGDLSPRRGIFCPCCEIFIPESGAAIHVKGRCAYGSEIQHVHPKRPDDGLEIVLEEFD